MTSRHWGPKRKLWAGYRALSLKCTSYLCGALLCCARYIFDRRVWHRALSLRYARIHHLCAKSHFCHGPHCWASPWKNCILNRSLAHSHSRFDASGTKAFTLEKLKKTLFNDLNNFTNSFRYIHMQVQNLQLFNSITRRMPVNFSTSCKLHYDDQNIQDQDELSSSAQLQYLVSWQRQVKVSVSRR